MIYIILPQALKNVLPALANEFIVLLKETSVSGYIAIQDLTKGGDIIRSQTYNALFPLLMVAAIYLIMVLFFEKLVSILERGGCVTVSVEKKETLIQVQNLTKTFGGSVHALNGVSTDIKKGEVVCVIGPSGSGKSTFLRCLNRLEDPTDGRIIFAGKI